MRQPIAASVRHTIEGNRTCFGLGRLTKLSFVHTINTRIALFIGDRLQADPFFMGNG